MPDWRDGSMSRRRRPWCRSPRPNPLRRVSSRRRATPCSAPAIRTATPKYLRADDPMRPCDLYSATKAEAEEIVRSSSLDWVVLRFGGVLSTDLSALPLSLDALFFESALPTDGRLHSVDVRDVALACAAATTADVGGRDPVDRRRRVTPPAPRRSRGERSSAAMGIPGALPRAGRATPTATATGSSPTGWTPAGRRRRWKFQHHSLPDMLAELRGAGRMEALSGSTDRAVVRAIMKRRSAYWKAPGQYADPWGAIRAKLGEPAPVTP